MMINLDVFFVQALNEAGYDLDFKRLKELYQRSRQNPAFIARRARNIRAEQEYEEWLAKNEEEERQREAERTAKAEVKKQKKREYARAYYAAKKPASLASDPVPEEAGQERMLFEDLPAA